MEYSEVRLVLLQTNVCVDQRLGSVLFLEYVTDKVNFSTVYLLLFGYGWKPVTKVRSKENGYHSDFVYSFQSMEIKYIEINTVF